MLFFQQIAPYIPLQLSVALFLLELCWPVAHFTFSLYSKFVDMTVNLGLILSTTRIQKQFPLSVFIFIDSLVVSASQDAGGYVISRQNNLELHLGCHTCWLRYFTLVCLWSGVLSRDYQNFSHRQITKFSYPWCSALHTSHAWSSANIAPGVSFKLSQNLMNTDRHLKWPDSLLIACRIILFIFV